MWRFRSSTDTLVSSVSSANSPDQSESNRGVVAYLKSIEGLQRVTVILCSLLALICAGSLPSCSLIRWNAFTCILVLSTVSTLLLLFSLRIPEKLTFFQWFAFEYIFGLVVGLCSFANSIAFFVMIHKQKSVGRSAAAQGFAGFFNLVIAMILVIHGLKNRRLWKGGSSGPGSETTDIVI